MFYAYVLKYKLKKIGAPIKKKNIKKKNCWEKYKKKTNEKNVELLKGPQCKIIPLLDRNYCGKQGKRKFFKLKKNPS